MKREDAGGAAPIADRVYTGVAVLAALLAFVQGPRSVAVVACVLLALVPWAVIATGRRLPTAAFAVLGVLPVVPLALLAGVGGALFLSTAVGSRVASRTDGRWLVVSTAGAVAVLPFLTFLVGKGETGAWYFAFGDGFGVIAGVLLRRAARLADDLRIADARLAEAGAREERHRIARDVHDLVAHSLTVVVLHVGGARRVLRNDPAAAEGALADAERVCRESLDGIRGVVGLLREDDAGHRGVTLDLDELAGVYRAAGLPVHIQATGAPESLPLLLRITLHRVVQEALANAARHAAPATGAVVEVTVDGAGALARITNERPVPAAPSTGPRPGGYGLIGLRERVFSLGGELTGRPEGNRWVVECRLPLRVPSARPGRSMSGVSACGAA